MTGTCAVTRPSSRPSSRCGTRKVSAILPPMGTRASPIAPGQVSPGLGSVTFTPPDKILPNTGGLYEGWEFHPSRLQALRLRLESQAQNVRDAGEDLDYGPSPDGEQAKKAARSAADQLTPVPSTNAPS